MGRRYDPKILKDIAGFLKRDKHGNYKVSDDKLVIGALMGEGKTTALIEYVADNFKMGSGQACYVVVERLNDAENIKEAIDTKVGSEICFVMYGRNKNTCYKMQQQILPEFAGWEEKEYLEGTTKFNMCKACSRKDCLAKDPWKYDEAKSFPVLIITHRRLQYMLEDPKHVGRVCQYGINRIRSVMFIDERPELVLTTKIELKELSKRRKEARDETSVISQSFAKRKLRKKVLKALDYLKNVIKEGQKDFPPMDLRMNLNMSEKTEWNTIDKLVKYGGRLFIDRADESNSCLHLAKYFPLQVEGVDKYILFDGTASVDPMYDVFLKVKVKEYKPRNSGTIRLHCRKEQKHKSSFKRELAEDGKYQKRIIDKIIEKHPKAKKIVVVTGKDFEEVIRGYGHPNIIVEHFNALKGKNHLRNRRVLIFSYIYQPPINHFRGFMAAAGYNLDDVFCDKDLDSYTWGFANNVIESVRIRTIIACLIQDIYRLRIRGNKKINDVDVYLGLTYGPIVVWLCKKFPNVEIRRSEISGKEQ